jgi:uncharacterized membrane protein HdeD (DUF308 family)
MSVSLLAPVAGAPHHDERASLSRLWWLFLILGLVSVFVGLLAISSAFWVTMASVVVLGVLLMIAGVAELIHAVMVRNLKGFALHLLSAALYLLVGLFMLEDPAQAAVVLTLLLVASFLVGGLLRIITALSAQFVGWQWVLFNGVVDVVLGILILMKWPDSGLWVIGVFLGIDLVFHGWSWVIVSLNVRTV